jgi:hypothetical protein
MKERDLGNFFKSGDPPKPMGASSFFPSKLVIVGSPTLRKHLFPVIYRVAWSE